MDKDNTYNGYKIILAKYFLQQVKPYKIQEDRIIININY